MPVHNNDISEIFNKVADLLDIEGANPYRIRAYRNAARLVGGMSQSLADMVARGEDLTELSGIGKDLAGKIEEIVKTGELAQLKELEGRTPGALSRLMNIEGLGPKRVQALHEELGVTTPEDLQEAARLGKIKDLKGFGNKIEQMILDRIDQIASGEQRFSLATAEPVAKSLEDYLKGVNGVKQVTVAGSYRRRKETVGDLDILVTCKEVREVMDAFVHYEDVTEVAARGETKSTVVLRSGMHVDLRVLPEESYGAALHYFTGSKAHNIAVRQMGGKKGLKINEYGILKDEKRVGGQEEEEVFKAVDLPFIEPELRENRGEIEAAQKGELPQLIKLDDIRGDLHAHTKTTDGHNTMEEMAQAAGERGYDYLAITNHSKRVSMTHGLDAKGLAKEIKRIEDMKAKLDGILLLKAIELDILEDGSLDLPDDILKELDLTVCSVHYNFKLSRKKQTERIIRAMDNQYFNILAHPTGRRIFKREPYDVDMEGLMKAARERGCYMELDSQPERLDLADIYCKLAKDLGVKVAIDTDAHSIGDLDFIRFGISQARRGWLEPDDVLNTRIWKDLQKLLQRT